MTHLVEDLSVYVSVYTYWRYTYPICIYLLVCIYLVEGLSVYSELL
eukprot:SAG31_NODE_3538_length_4145_cov_1.703658_4_plen_46_part_00